MDEGSFTCSCRLFTRIGFLCRHMFCLFNTELIDSIPEMYIPTRRRNDALSSSMFNIEYKYGAPLDERSKIKTWVYHFMQPMCWSVKGRHHCTSYGRTNETTKGKIWQKIPIEPACNNKSIIIQELHRRLCKNCNKHVRDHGSRNFEKVRKAKELRRKQRRENGIYEDSSDGNGAIDDEDEDTSESDDEEEEYMSSSD